MKIVIDKNWWGRYEFYEGDNDKFSFYGHAAYLIFKGDYANIYNTSKEKEIHITYGKVGSFWRPNETTLLIDFTSKRLTIEVNCKNYRNGYWTFSSYGSTYDLYYHGRKKKSLYKNGDQVAKFVKANGLDYIISNSDEDILLLIGLFTAFNMGDLAPDDNIGLDIRDDVKDENKIWQPVR